MIRDSRYNRESQVALLNVENVCNVTQFNPRCIGMHVLQFDGRFDSTHPVNTKVITNQSRFRYARCYWDERARPNSIKTEVPNDSVDRLLRFPMSKLPWKIYNTTILGVGIQFIEFIDDNRAANMSLASDESSSKLWVSGRAYATGKSSRPHLTQLASELSLYFLHSMQF